MVAIVVRQGAAPAWPERPPLPSRPDVSVVIPAYNCGRYIGESIDSVLAQDYPPAEVIVVDDGSTDDTVDVVRRYGDRVRLVTQANAGPAAARNRGVALASGPLIAFNDGDDVWLPGKLRAQVDALLAHPEAGIVYGAIDYWYARRGGSFALPDRWTGATARAETDETMSGDLYTTLLLDSAVCIITVLMPKATFERLGGFDVTLPTGEDYDLWLRASRDTRFLKLKSTLALYRRHGGSTTKVPRPASNEYLTVCRALARYGDADREGVRVDARGLAVRLSRLCFEHGYLHYKAGDPRVALRSLVQSIRHGGPRSRAFVLATMALAKTLTHRLRT